MQQRRDWLIGVTAAFAAVIILSGRDLLADLSTQAKLGVVIGLIVAFTLLGTAIVAYTELVGLVAVIGFLVLAASLGLAWLGPMAGPTGLVKLYSDGDNQVCGELGSVSHGLLSFTAKVRAVDGIPWNLGRGDTVGQTHDVQIMVPVDSIHAIIAVDAC